MINKFIKWLFRIKSVETINFKITNFFMNKTLNLTDGIYPEEYETLLKIISNDTYTEKESLMHLDNFFNKLIDRFTLGKQELLYDLRKDIAFLNFEDYIKYTNHYKEMETKFIYSLNELLKQNILLVHEFLSMEEQGFASDIKTENKTLH